MGKSGGSYRTSSSTGVCFCRTCKEPLGENARKRLYVCNLPACGEQDVREAFEEYGDIKYVKLIKDQDTLEPKGFGYIEYRNLDDAVKARYKMNGEELPGYRYAYISVDYAADKISQGPAPIDYSPESYSTYKRKAKRKSISPRKCNRSGSYSSASSDDEPEVESKMTGLSQTDKSMGSPTSAEICDGCGRPLVDNASRTLCVHNLDPAAQGVEADLEKAFGRYGRIKKVTLSRYGDSAFVVYRDISHAAKAREMMNWKIPGHSNSWVDYAEKTMHPKSGSVAPIDSTPESYSSYIRYSPHNDAPQSITDDIFEDDQPEFK